MSAIILIFDALTKIVSEGYINPVSCFKIFITAYGICNAGFLICNAERFLFVAAT
jgi:hypothetical protein